MKMKLKTKLGEGVQIVFKKDCILVYLKKELFLKQEIIKHTINYKQNKDYTFFFVILTLHKFGLVDFF